MRFTFTSEARASVQRLKGRSWRSNKTQDMPVLDEFVSDVDALKTYHEYEQALAYCRENRVGYKKGHRDMAGASGGILGSCWVSRLTLLTTCTS